MPRACRVARDAPFVRLRSFSLYGLGFSFLAPWPDALLFNQRGSRASQNVATKVTLPRAPGRSRKAAETSLHNDTTNQRQLRRMANVRSDSRRERLVYFRNSIVSRQPEPCAKNVRSLLDCYSPARSRSTGISFGNSLLGDAVS